MKPTTKEVEFFCHPNQAWLQELWEPDVFDVFTFKDGDDSLYVVWDVHQPVNPRKYWRVDYIYWSLYTESEVIVTSDQDVCGLCWLPTLSDLLGMIEEAAEKRTDADGWKLRFAPGLGYRATLPDCLYPLQEDAVAGPWENTILIAAAELLKRLKEEEDEVPTGADEG